jgi:hypothetical protein
MLELNSTQAVLRQNPLRVSNLASWLGSMSLRDLRPRSNRNREMSQSLLSGDDVPDPDSPSNHKKTRILGRWEIAYSDLRIGRRVASGAHGMIMQPSLVGCEHMGGLLEIFSIILLYSAFVTADLISFEF